jgi:type I restriction enzyme, S subunit
MSMRLEYCKLGEVIHITSGKECPPENKTENSSIPIRGATGVIGYSKEPLYERPIILVGRVGAGLLSGMSGILNRAENPCWPSDNTLVIIPKEDDDFDYIEYCLRYSEIYPYVSGSSQPLLTQTALKLLEIPWPSRETRHMIANNGRQIDQLLLMNKNIMNISQEIISALFRSWFIDFDPIKAKAEGKFPNGMDEETAALFPAFFEDSELGPIPSGWRILTLDEILDTIIDHRGLTPKKLGGDWAEEGYPAISAMNIKNGKIVKRQNIEYISEELYRKWMKVELKSGDILLTSEAPLGEIYYLFDEEKMVTSQRVFGIRSNPNLMPSIFLRYYLDSHFGQYELHARASGSTVSGIRQSELRKIKIITPPLEIMNYFSNKVKPLIANQYNCDNQIISLGQTLDALLPRLMSGELSVS